MILRNAIVAEDRRIVGRAPRGVAALSGAVGKEAAAAAAGASEPSSTPDAALTPLAAPVREQRLTFEAVAAWLAVQDVETRAACASVLAEELMQVREAARADGYAAGQAQAREEAQRAVTGQLTLLESLAQSAAAAFEQEQQRLADSCADIVAEAFAKIAGPLLATREAVVGGVVEVLKRVKEAREVTVRVNPADLSILVQHEPRLAATLPGCKLVIVPDARVGIGGCIVDSKLGSLDGRLEAQLRGLYETLRAAKSSQAEGS